MSATWRLVNAGVLDALAELEDESVQCVVTSPPYWGLRDYGVEGMIGLEATLQEHLAVMVAVFREVRRVLRSDGVCWLNYGDAYSSGCGARAGYDARQADTSKPAGKHRRKKKKKKQVTVRRKGSAETAANRERAKAKGYDVGAWGASAGASEGFDRFEGQVGLAAKQRMLLPARVAIALQDDGWWVRSEIVWAKGVSFCPDYAGSCMPSSVRDRPTDSHEMVYMLTKSPRYFYDGDAVRERDGGRSSGNLAEQTALEVGAPAGKSDNRRRSVPWAGGAGRNLRTVWTINPQPYSEAHFATFPMALVEPCVRSSTSAHGACSECGAPWRRVVERDISECETRREVERRAPVDLEGMSAYLKEQRKARGLSQKAVDEFLGTNTLYSWFEGRAKGIQAPTPEVWAKLKEVLGLDDRFDEQINGTVLVEVTVDRGGDRGDSAPSRGQILPARVTTGWEPTCEHADAPTRPCAVLDPFAGSGTTGAVALREGCSFVGIELNPDYVALAERRIAAAAPSLFCTRTP